jgi:hypothetical protein
MLYRNKSTGEYLKLYRVRESGINTYVQVDEKGNEVLIKRSWSVRKQKQLRLISDLRSLEIVIGLT